MGRMAAGGIQDSDRASFRPDIEGLRAVAILLVVIGHLGVSWMPSGFIGVDVFFVISGFVITESFIRRGLASRDSGKSWQSSVSDFYARRIRRLLPASSLVLIVTAAASMLLLPEASKHVNGLSIAAAAAYVGNLYFATLVSSHAPANEVYGPVANFWSLGVEEQFYLFWPWLLVLAIPALRLGLPRTARTAAVARAGWLLVAVFAVSLISSIALTPSSPAWAFYSPLTRVWEMAAGGLIAVSLPSVMLLDRRIRLGLGWAGLLIVIWAAVRLSPYVPYPGWHALIPVAGTAMIIIGGTRSADESRTAASVPALLSIGPMRQLGRWSYSWYLWHWPILVLGTLAWVRFVDPDATLGKSVWPWPPWLGALLVAVALGAASLTYAFVELPARTSGRWMTSLSRTYVIGAALTALAAAAGLALAHS